MKIAALILAAGSASRFGSLKQLASINNKPMLQHCIDSANGPLSDNVYTLLGHQSKLIKSNITGTKVIEHPEWERGIGSSIAVGVDYLSKDFEAILIMLGDQPMIKSAHVEQLIALFKEQHQDQLQKEQPKKAQSQKDQPQNYQQIVCSQYQNNLAVPAIFSKTHFHDLMQLDGDQGAKQLLTNLSPPPKVLALEKVYKDVDHPQDLIDVALETSS